MFKYETYEGFPNHLSRSGFDDPSSYEKLLSLLRLQFGNIYQILQKRRYYLDYILWLFDLSDPDIVFYFLI